MRRAAATLLLSATLGACAATPPPAPAMAPQAASGDAAAERIKPFQYLYGSGEGGALAIQAYHALVDFARRQVAERPRDGVVLDGDPGNGPARFVPCGDKPFAAIFDVDETTLANLGYEALVAEGRSSREIFQYWQRSGSHAVAPIPGALYAVGALRQMGVTVIFNTNRDADTAASTAAMLEAAGFGPTVRGETLFLSGDVDGKPGKDGRRAAIAAKFCVIAMGGDQLGDFADLFNVHDLAAPDRRTMALRGWAAQLWGNGWFLMPNPVYGPALRGGINDIFPADKRWTDDAKDPN